VFWNSTYIADAVAHLRAAAEPAPDAWLAHTSPLSWELESADDLCERMTLLAGVYHRRRCCCFCFRVRLLS
jgi:hypothetical protein